jgi:hypothetical protein
MQKKDDEKSDQATGCGGSYGQAEHIEKDEPNLNHPNDAGEGIVVLCEHVVMFLTLTQINYRILKLIEQLLR